MGEMQLNMHLRADFHLPDERVSANAVPLISALLRRISWNTKRDTSRSASSTGRTLPSPGYHCRVFGGQYQRLYMTIAANCSWYIGDFLFVYSCIEREREGEGGVRKIVRLPGMSCS